MNRKRHVRLWIIVFTAILCLTLLFVFMLQGAQRRHMQNTQELVQVQPPAAAMELILAEDVSPLTGLPLTDRAARDKRILAVAVDNMYGGRPQRGLSEAQIVMEVTIDSYLTRLLALYEDYTRLPQVGPLRSARMQMFELVLPFQPILISRGSNVYLNRQTDEYNYWEWHLGQNERGQELFYTINRAGVPYEHTVYTDGEHLGEVLEKYEIRDERTYSSGYFTFMPYKEIRPLENEGGEQLTIYFSATPDQEGEASFGMASRLVYDADDARYRFYQKDAQGEYTATVDENNGEQLAFDNVLILFAQMGWYDDNPGTAMVEVDYGGGVGFYYYGGRYEMVRWSKGGPQEGLKLHDAAGTGEPIYINTGTTYMAVVDIENAVYYTHGFAGQEQPL